MYKEERKRVPIPVALAVFAAALLLVIFGGKILGIFGVYASLISELFFLFISLIAVVACRVPLKNVLPVKKVRFRQIAGMAVLYLGANYIISGITVIMQILFPFEMAKLVSDMTGAIGSMTFWQGLIIVGISAAVCEEVMCRGVFLNAFSRIRSKGVVVAIIGVLFGILHFDPFRFFITGILGAVIAYIMIETENIFMPMLYHFVNNTLSLIVNHTTDYSALTDTLLKVDIASRITNFVSFIYAAAGVFVVFAGVLLIRKNREKTEALKKTNKRLLTASAVIAGLFITSGIVYIFVN